MMEFREKHALEGAIRRLRKNSTMSRITHLMTPFDMFNDVQDHVLKTAQTHIDRVVLEAFVAGVDRTEDPAAKLLDTVCDLYALSTIEADKAWFLEHGQLTPARAKLLTSTVNQLLRELRPHMRRWSTRSPSRTSGRPRRSSRRRPTARRRWPPRTPRCARPRATRRPQSATDLAVAPAQ